MKNSKTSLVMNDTYNFDLWINWLEMTSNLQNCLSQINKNFCLSYVFTTNIFFCFSITKYYQLNHGFRSLQLPAIEMLHLQKYRKMNYVTFYIFYENKYVYNVQWNTIYTILIFAFSFHFWNFETGSKLEVLSF